MGTMFGPSARFERPVYGLERVWLVADALAHELGDPPFVNQQVVECGEGGSLAPEHLGAAVAGAGAAWAGLTARLSGMGRWTRWTHGEGAPSLGFRVEAGARWDGTGPDGAPWLLDRLDPSVGPLAEVVYLPVCADGVARIVVRTHHAMVDGRAAGAFTADVFRVLRGQAPLGAVEGPSDVSLAGAAAPEVAPDATPVLRPVRGCAPTWRRVSWQGPTRELLPRVLLALARASEEGGDARWRFSVPADLRVTHELARMTQGASFRGDAGGPALCANLTGLLRVELHPDEPIARLRARLDAARAAAGAPVHAAHALRDVPLSVLGWFGRRGAEALVSTGRSEVSATVSNLGRADLPSLSCPGWASTRTWWIPPGSRGNACFVSLSGGPAGIELVACAPVPAEALARYLSRVTAVLDGEDSLSPERA